MGYIVTSSTVEVIGLFDSNGRHSVTNCLINYILSGHQNVRLSLLDDTSCLKTLGRLLYGPEIKLKSKGWKFLVTITKSNISVIFSHFTTFSSLLAATPYRLLSQGLKVMWFLY